MDRAPKIIISGGGSGGHIFPAIAIANAIKELEANADILFIGAKGKIEMEKVPKAGYPIIGLWISGFHRKSILRNLTFPFKLIGSIVKAAGILRRFKPDVVVGVGGFASGPTLEVASRKKIPTLVQEQNSFPGATNRLLAKKVDKFCVASDKLERFFPKEKILLTGNPVRQDLEGKSREEGIQHFGMDPNKKTILIVGGSLGARTINDSVEAQAELIGSSNDIQIFWQTGKLYIEEFEKGKAASLNNVKAQAFIDRMDLAYAMADMVIGRAGALTIAELCIVKKPALFVPSPNVAEDHQTANAKALVEKKAALIVKDSEAKARMIPDAIALLNDEAQCKEFSANIGELAKPDAAKNIAQEVLKLIKQK